MASDRFHSEILRQAAEVVGGEARLAQHLDVGADQMHEWIQGKENASGGLYLIALDILSRSRSAPKQKKAPEGSSLAGL
jgi:hypothetical protein